MNSRWILVAAVLGIVLISCGKGETPSEPTDTDWPKEQPSEKPQAGIPLAQIFDRGNYRCTIETSQGIFILKTRDNKFRYEGKVNDAPFAMIVEQTKAQTILYTYVAQQDKWFKLSLDNAQAKQQPGLITKESAVQYPKHECSRASNPESDFTVPPEKVMEQPMFGGTG